MSATMAPPVVATGRFVWRDVMTTDPETAKAFYSELLGWTTRAHDMGGGMVYEILKNGDEEFGGIMALDPAHGVPSHWISYIEVPSVDEAVASAVQNGGRVGVEPMDIPNVGRFAVVGDPQGTYFSPFTSIPMENADATASQPEGMPPLGGVTWNELITGDIDGAKTFYGDIFGWRFDEMNMMEGHGHYYVAKQGDRMDCGMMAKPDELPVSLWVIYYHVADLEHSLAEVSRLGGQPASPIIDVPGIGRMAWVTDPTGALFALHQEPK